MRLNFSFVQNIRIQKQEKAKAIRESQRAKMQSLLTPAQKAQMEKNKTEAKERGKMMGEKRKEMEKKKGTVLEIFHLSQ